MTIKTAPTILTTVNLEGTGYNNNTNAIRWGVKYYLTRTEITLATVTRESSRVVVIKNIPEAPIFDENGVQTGTTPAITDLTDWMLTWSSLEELIAASIDKAVIHANII